MRGKVITKLIVFSALLVFPASLSAQQKPSFLVDSLNVIRDRNGSLNNVFKTLHLLKQQKNTDVISFLHIGDSHTQAGFFTRVVRTSLQKEFGNAGLGLIVPLKLAGTNQPRDYAITSDIKWEFGRIATNKNTFNFGLSGIAIQTKEPNFSLNIEAKYDSINSIDYNFNKVTVFHNNTLALTTENPSYILNFEKRSPYAYTIKLNENTRQLHLIQPNKKSVASTFHAFSLENGNSGVLYHTAGVNGARFRDFCNIPLLFEQSKQLNPQVIIISLGTNESVETPLSIKGLIENLDCLVKNLRKVNPSTIFILTTPAENFRRYQRKHIPNERIILVRDAIMEYAEVNEIAYWDLFEATGGKGSNYKWKQSGLLGYDQIHFSIEGYELQGQLFFEAFIKSYHTYVAEHRVE